MPLVLLCAIAVICLSLVVHRQWSQFERLRYPIAEVANTLIDREPDRVLGPVFRHRIFWIALISIAAVNVVNYIHLWHPESIEIPLYLDLRFILREYPVLARTPGANRVFDVHVYPTAVAFAFLLASDVSFSLGISQILFLIVSATLLNVGVDLSENRMTGGVFPWQRFGSYVAFALLLLYMGRSTYWNTLREALTFRRRKENLSYAVWACRILLLSLTAMVLILVSLGLNAPFAVVLVLAIMMMFLVLSRIVAESGLILPQSLWAPLAAFVGFFGYEAMGPKAVVIIGIVCCVFVIDPRESLMPFMVNALRLCDPHRIRPSRFGLGAVGIYVMSLGIAVPVVLWANYNYGRPRWDYFANQMVPRFTFDAADRAVSQLKLSNRLEQSEGYSAWDRIVRAKPQTKFLWAAGAGFAVVLVASVMRLRFSRWPIHPILFLGWSSWGFRVLCHSFLVGWLIKFTVARLGGSRTYQGLKPLMIGIIAGDLLSGLSFMLYGAIYHARTGLVPEVYRVLPS